MVKKSTKSRPKRVTLGEKYMRIRKAKQKLAKDKRKAKKESKQRALQGGRKPPRKDPGVPASWPFREEFLKEMAFEKARILDKKKKAKMERYAQKKLLLEAEGNDEDAATPMEALKLNADERQKEYDVSLPEDVSTSVTKQGGIDRSFYKEFKKVVELADVVIEVLDARDPLPCRSREVENFVRSSGPEKRIILLLNKIDLAPREMIERWLKYLREELPTVAFKSSTQKQHQNLGQANKKGLGQKSKTQMCLGAENLLQLLKNYARNKNIKTAITVGIVGMPNVGKSSVINSLKRTRVAHVGNRPGEEYWLPNADIAVVRKGSVSQLWYIEGVTTSIQEVHLDKHIRLLDSPGIIASSEQGPLMGCVKTEQIEDPIGVVAGVLSRVSSQKLADIYQTEEFDTADKFLELLALSRGKLKRGGIPDMAAAAKMVLQDWNNGTIPYYVSPPERAQGESVRLVQDWAADFNIDEISDEQLLSSVGALDDLENSVVAAMSGLDFKATSNPQAERATKAVAETSPPEIEPKEEQSMDVAPTNFEGAAAGFDGMLKQTAFRTDLGNVSKTLTAISMDQCVQEVDMDAADKADKSANSVTKSKRKRRKLTAEKKAKPVEIPLPKGLVEEDGDSKDENNEGVEVISEGKRKKKSKKSSDMYDNEGQLNPHKVRIERKRQKKLKVKKQKSVADAKIEANKLADHVKGSVNLDIV